MQEPTLVVRLINQLKSPQSVCEIKIAQNATVAILRQVVATELSYLSLQLHIDCQFKIDGPNAVAVKPNPSYQEKISIASQEVKPFFFPWEDSSQPYVKKPCKIRIFGPKEAPATILKGFCDTRPNFINTTSKSTVSWHRQLSPFFLGPIPIYYKDIQAKNMENAWQYGKVFPEEADEDKNPTKEYFEWAKRGWLNSAPQRFPKGRGAKPHYFLWENERYLYIPARKKFYAPVYSKTVVDTDAFKALKKLYEEQVVLYLWDFDGYDFTRYYHSYYDVIHSPKRPLGHSFVLGMTLEGVKYWEEEGEEVVPEDVTKPSLVFSPASNGANYVFVSCVGDREITDGWQDGVPCFCQKINAVSWEWTNEYKSSLIVELSDFNAANHWCALSLLSWELYLQLSQTK